MSGKKKKSLEIDRLKGGALKTLMQERGIGEEELAAKLDQQGRGSIPKWKTGAAWPFPATERELEKQLAAPQGFFKKIGAGVRYEEALQLVNKNVTNGDINTEEKLRVQVEWLPLVEEPIVAGTGGSVIEIDTLKLLTAQLLPVPKVYIRGKARRCLLRVKNDSMIPDYNPGDIIMVNLDRHDLKNLPKKAVAAWVPDIEAGMLKILHEHAVRSEWLLVSLNPKYPPVPVPKGQHGFHAFHVEGVVFPALSKVTG
jgi:phage repressor protein C with HTH and peptisase S24 domain